MVLDKLQGISALCHCHHTNARSPNEALGEITTVDQFVSEKQIFSAVELILKYLFYKELSSEFSPAKITICCTPSSTDNQQREAAKDQN